MSDAVSGGAGAVGSPAITPNTANDANGAAMPAVPKEIQRGSLEDFQRLKREGKLGAQAPKASAAQPGAQAQQPQSARAHLAEKSREMEAQQSANAGEQADPPTAPAPSEEVAAEAQDADPVNEQTPEGSLSDADIIAKYREWEKSDLAPEEIFSNKLHPVKVRGVERFVDYGELRQGYMRGADYTQKGVELKQKEQRVQQQQRALQEHFEAIRDPNNMLEIFERNGYSEQIEKVAEMVAQRRIEHRNLVIAAGRAAAERLGFSSDEIRAGQADNHRDVVEAMRRADERLMQTRKLEIENRKLAFERQDFEAKANAQRHEQEVLTLKSTYERQLTQLRPGAFKAHGIQDTPQNKQAFLRHLNDVISLEGMSKEGFTRAQVMAATSNLREELRDRMQAEEGAGAYSQAEIRARAQAEAKRAALGPNRTGTGAGKPLQAQQSTAKRVDDFSAARRNRLLGR